MKIQSLSIVVPNKGCINKCPFCVSRMVNSDQYENRMDINHPHYDINVREYLKRLRFVAENGCQTLMLTGTSEPQQNKQFLATFALLHQQLGSPFTNIEMQTTGFRLDCDHDYIRFLRNFVGVNTIALSINSIDDRTNCEILGHQSSYLKSSDGSFGTYVPPLQISRLCDLLKEYDFNIRCCFNLSEAFNGIGPETLFEKARKDYHADQVTFRKLYVSDKGTEQGKWIAMHEFSHNDNDLLKSHLRCNYPIIGKTLYGAAIRDVMGMSVIYDEDCMGKNPETEVKKFLILRPNCKLYSQWDSPASLVN